MTQTIPDQEQSPQCRILCSVDCQKAKKSLSSADKQQQRTGKLRMVSNYGGTWYSRESKKMSSAFHHHKRNRFVETTFAVRDSIEELISSAATFSEYGRKSRNVDLQTSIEVKQTFHSQTSFDDRCEEVSDVPSVTNKLCVAGQNYGGHRFRAMSRSFVRQTIQSLLDFDA